MGHKEFLKQNFSDLSWPIIWFPVQKNFFGPTWKFDPKSYLVRVFWNFKILKNPSCHQMWDFRYCKLNFQGFQIFKNFYLKYFQKWEAVFQNKKKIRLDKYFVILSWKCAPVGKIKSFTVTSGLRISKFRIFYFIRLKKDKFHWTHCTVTHNTLLFFRGIL